jgi:phosphopentomutase
MTGINKKALVVVLDSVGCGALDDAYKYGDEEANTILHIVEQEKHIAKLNNFRKIGLFNIDGLQNNIIKSVEQPLFSYGRLREISEGKDTTTGHFEIAGAVVKNAYKTYPDGIPTQILDEFCRLAHTEIIGGGLPASGTEIIERLGDEHIKTGKPIVYTSADSVFQIAADEDTFGLDRLYEICEVARNLLTGDIEISRIIARPFIKASENFKRTENRKDYSVLPPSKTILAELAEKSYDVIGVGKIEDIFSGQGITKSYHTTNNKDGIIKTLELISSDNINGLVFVNLVDFDMLYGHRRDTTGYLFALEQFDEYIPKLMRDDMLTIITADHGCDPAHTGTDHTREYVPFLMYEKNKVPVNLGTVDGLYFVADKLREYFFAV